MTLTELREEYSRVPAGQVPYYNIKDGIFDVYLESQRGIEPPTSYRLWLEQTIAKMESKKEKIKEILG